MAPGESPSIAEVAAGLRAGIYAGDYAPGAKLPTREKIAREHGLSLESAGTALRMLAAEGLVALRQGAGTYACQLYGYRVRVTVHWMTGEGTARRLMRDIARSCRAAEKAEPAVTGLELAGVDPDEWAWTWQMTVRAARASRAAVIGEDAAMAAAAGRLGDFAGASVSAEPA